MVVDAEKVYKDINKVNENQGITKLVYDNAINTMNSNSNGIFKIKFKAFSTYLCLEYVVGKKNWYSQIRPLQHQREFITKLA